MPNPNLCIVELNKPGGFNYNHETLLKKVLLHVYPEDPLLALEQILELLIPCPTSPYIYIYLYIYICMCVCIKKKKV